MTVIYATGDGTAVAGSDYVAAAGTVTFNPGITTQTVTVRVNGDTTFEANETFTVNLSGATNAAIVGGTGTGTITAVSYTHLDVYKRQAWARLP